ncbi:MAG: hypothetical protein ACLFN8_03130 [Candidatus Woesearchaeota archaeon]
MKKAMADTNKQLYWTIFLIPIIAIFGFLIFYSVPEIILIKTQLNNRLEDNALQDMLLSNPTCFAYDYDDIKTGHIDLKKFQTQTLHDCLEDYDQKRPFSISLHYDGQEQKEITSRDFQITRRTITYDRPVIIINNTRKNNGMLKINVMYS